VKVYSFVAGVPFSPIDIDLGHLSRGEWNAITDRFRVWYMPGEDGKSETQLCYVMVRKLDPHDGVLTYAHVMVNLRGNGSKEDGPNFMVGVLSNDDVRARTAVNAMLDIPPIFHRRAELETIERKWRSDPDAVFRFTANVHSATALASTDGAVYELKFELPPGITEQFRQNMGAWWHNPSGTNGDRPTEPSGK
jgi:hypothetical protein